MALATSNEEADDSHACQITSSPDFFSLDGSLTFPGANSRSAALFFCALPTHYVPVGSKNQGHLRCNPNLQFLRRLIKEWQDGRGGQLGHGKSRPSADQLRELKQQLYDQLKLFHGGVELPELKYVEEVDTAGDSTEPFGGRHYRRLSETELKDVFKGKYNFKEFLPPLDSSVVNEAHQKSRPLAQADPEGVRQFNDLVVELYKTIFGCPKFRDLMEEEFLKIINDAWDRINGFNLHKKFRGGRHRKKRKNLSEGNPPDRSMEGQERSMASDTNTPTNSQSQEHNGSKRGKTCDSGWVGRYLSCVDRNRSLDEDGSLCSDSDLSSSDGDGSTSSNQDCDRERDKSHPRSPFYQTDNEACTGRDIGSMQRNRFDSDAVMAEEKPVVNLQGASPNSALSPKADQEHGAIADDGRSLSLHLTVSPYELESAPVLAPYNVEAAATSTTGKACKEANIQLGEADHTSTSDFVLTAESSAGSMQRNRVDSDAVIAEEKPVANLQRASPNPSALSPEADQERDAIADEGRSLSSQLTVSPHKLESTPVLAPCNVEAAVISNKEEEVNAIKKQFSVFISHTWKDTRAADFAAYLEKELKVEGAVCFYDQTCLQPSDNLHRRIQVEAKACAVFVAILSPAYCQRYWCMLELDVAIQNERTILPVFFDEVTGPGELPREEEFRNFFANDERVNKEILDRWWSNISQNLPAIYGIRMCSLARTRGRLVSLQDDVLSVIRGTSTTGKACKEANIQLGEADHTSTSDFVLTAESSAGSMQRNRVGSEAVIAEEKPVANLQRASPNPSALSPEADQERDAIVDEGRSLSSHLTVSPHKLESTPVLAPCNVEAAVISNKEEEVNAIKKQFSVFISHTWKDTRAADFGAYLEKELKVEGTACFYDQTCLQTSDNLHRRIQVEAKACAVFVAILSPAYCQRYWCMLELDVAIQNERTILPVFFDEVTGPGELPREEEFRNFFANDERVNKEILDRWWSNISQNLPAIYGIRMCSLARTRGRLVSLQDDVLSVIRGTSTTGKACKEANIQLGEADHTSTSDFVLTAESSAGSMQRNRVGSDAVIAEEKPVANLQRASPNPSALSPEADQERDAIADEGRSLRI